MASPSSPSGAELFRASAQQHIARQEQQLAQQQQQITHLQQQLLAAAGSSSVSASSAPPSASSLPLSAELLARLVPKPPLPPPEQWKGTTGHAVNRWLETLEGQHAYYGRTDAERCATVVALLVDPALSEYRAETKEKGEPSDYAALCARLRARWSFVEEEFHVRKELKVLVARGAALRPAVYAEQFRQLASKLPNESASGLIFQFGEGLRPSLRVKVYEKNHTTLAAALLQVCRNDAVYTAHGVSSSSSSAPSRASADDMDVGALEHLPEENRATFLTALQEINPTSSRASSSLPSFLSEEIASLVQAQLAAASLAGGSNKPFKGNKNKTQAGQRGLSPLADIPTALRKLREAYGLCIRCGVERYSAGPEGHNSGTCKRPVDKSTVPPGFTGKIPSFQ
jgi:hypothetical protein